MTARNPHELAARYEKCRRLIGTLDRHLATDAHAKAGKLAAELATWPRSAWRVLAAAACVREPSEESRRLVIEEYQRRAETRPRPVAIVRDAFQPGAKS